MPATKRRRPARAPAPLGVLEFASALNGDDPLLVLEKLRHFMKVVGYERRLALSPTGGGDVLQVDGHGGDAESGDGGSDADSVFSLDEEDEGQSSKRQKIDGSTKTPSWKLDKKNYQVPFVGTSVSKGATGTVTPGAWPTGFLEAYRGHSPTGVELIGNEYIGALPPGGIHKRLCKDSGFGLAESSGKKRKGDGGGLTRGEITSAALQTNYWLAISEWILGFASVDALQRELGWEEGFDDVPIGNADKPSSKCSIPPPVMTILMKQRLPEWVDAVHNYATRQRRYAQQMQKERQQEKKRQQKLQEQSQKQSKEEQQLQRQLQKEQELKREKRREQRQRQQRRDEKLLLSAVRNLIALCHLSDGTAKEVLRKLTSGTASSSSKGGAKSGTGGKGGGKPAGSGGGDGTAWMAQVLQQGKGAPSSLEAQEECIRLVCTLLETRDSSILSRLTEAPVQSLKQGGKSSRGDSGSGPAYLALRYGTQGLLELAKGTSSDQPESVSAYARSMTRLLRGMREVILPPSTSESDGCAGGTKGFVLGVGQTADVLSGVVLSNLAKLSSMAPAFDATSDFIKRICDGRDAYGDLTPIETASVNARRILFLLLTDTRRSPFLHGIHSVSGPGRRGKNEEQASLHLAQLSKALHGMLASQGHNQSMKALLGMCLSTTPDLTPHFFRGMQLSDPRASYRSLEVLTFVEGVLRDAPLPSRAVTSNEGPEVAAERAVSAIVPPCVTKNLLGKVVQSQSALLVSSGLKLIVTILRRSLSCISEVTEGPNELKRSILEAVMINLPETSLLFSIPSRFDPFEPDEENSSSSRANAIVMLQLCEALQCYVRLDSSSMAYVKFDWTRLVPESQVFLTAEPLLQHRILKTLHEVSRVCQAQFSPRMLPSVLSILLSANVPEVYTMARTLALSLMERELFPNAISDDEVMQCRNYEASLWIDGISAGTVEELVDLTEESKRQRVQNKIMISQAWANASMGYAMPPVGVSSLLSSSIHRVLGNSGALSDEISSLLVRISLKMLLYQYNPKPFAAIIVHSEGERTSDLADGLQRVAENILRDDPKTSACIESVASDMFGPDSLRGLFPKTNAENGEDAQFIVSRGNRTALRESLSLIKYSGGNDDGLNPHLRKTIIDIIETGDSVANDVMPRLAAELKSHSLKPADAESILIMLLAAVKSKRLDFGVDSLLDCNDEAKPASSATQLVSEVLRSTLVPAHCSSTFIAQICRHCCSALQSSESDMSALKDFSMMLLLHVLPLKEISDDSSSLSPGAMFDLWALVAGSLNTMLAVELSLRLEDCLAAMFASNDGDGTWALYKRICSMTHEKFVDMCVKSLPHQRQLDNDRDCAFLRAVLEYDCSGFSCLSSILASAGLDTETSKLWDCGSLDRTAATFVLQANRQKGASDILANESFADAANAVGTRHLSLLGQSVATPKLGLVLHVLEALCANGFILHEAQKSILMILDRVESGSVAWTIDDEIKMIDLAVCVGDSLNSNGENAAELLTRALVRSCNLLPKQIKKMVRTKREAESHWVDSLSSIMASMIENTPSFDDVAVKQSSNAIVGCIVACLKYGMMESNRVGSSSILGGCLRIIRLVMLKSHSGTEAQGLGSITPAQVHAMALSHSSFQSALSGSTTSERGDMTQQMELIRLLLCTLSLGAKEVKIGSDTWASICSVYNASTSDVDRLIRRLLLLYEQNGCCENEIMMNDLRWGALASKHSLLKDADQSNNDDTDESWEWLVESIESERIRYTLTQFPVSDTLVPLAYSGVDIECADGSASESNDGPERETNDEDSATSEDESNGERSAGARPVPTIANDEWRGGGDDLRYSPGFILPLILATLEAHLPDEEIDPSIGSEKAGETSPDDGHAADKNDDQDSQCQAFVTVCRRTCDRGGIALAIASLSSRCPSMRRVAVAICGLFLKALQMPESHNMKSWRVRPQQEMIMSSIQRGLAVRRAIQIQRYESQGGVELGGMRKHHVPMIPAVSAIFLAKVHLILSKPRDDMYGQMNRYFLRLQDYHGAFQDFFGLPAFLSLYCSSADEMSRCRAERNWALLSLKDGSVDEFSYRIISQHHVPELIMSSFDSLLGDPESRSELYLTMDIVETLILSGGTRASSHLIQRQGLLSWLHGITSWRKISSLFPQDTLKCKFLQLVSTSVNSYRRVQSSDDADAFFEKVPLANAVVHICLAEADAPAVDTESGNPSPSPLLEMACNALWAIFLADRESKDTFTCQGSTTLGEATSLLQKCARYEEMFGKVLTCLCDLPLTANDCNPSSAKPFVELALAFILEAGARLGSDTIVLSMKRVSELVTLHPDVAGDSETKATIKRCRHIAVLSGGIDIWDRFRPYLEDNL